MYGRGQGGVVHVVALRLFPRDGRMINHLWLRTHTAQFKLLKNIALGCIHVCLFNLTLRRLTQYHHTGC